MDNERLLNKYNKAINMLMPLEEANEDILTAKDFAACEHKNPEKIYKVYRDSLIQRFKYSFDVTWKYVAEFLEAEGRIIENKSPKGVFRECLKAKILSDLKFVRLLLWLTIVILQHMVMMNH